ncbi:hypothetical protein [Gottfriedia solisilvae]|uniref:hypothetical protein n=1 Tax=Gottfriedia solisilvae TaxID=1516104 RepID=UPI003D2EA069
MKDPGNKTTNISRYDDDDIARICEVAIVLNSFNIEVEDLHDFYHNHVKVIYEEWNNPQTKFQNSDEEGYITEFANRVASERYGD